MTPIKALFLACLLALSGCIGTMGESLIPIDAIADVAGDAVKEPRSTAKGATAGMSSSDAANVLINRDYYRAAQAIAGAGKGTAQTILHIKARPGKPITIDAEELTVYAPPPTGAAQMAIQAPAPVESSGIKWFREIRRGLTDVLLPLAVFKERSETDRLRIVTDGQIRRGELDVIRESVTGAHDIAEQAIETYKPPEPIIVPAAAPAE